MNIRLDSKANRIGKLRKENGLTQTELSKRTGISQAVLNKMENGTRRLHVDDMVMLADFFAVTLDYIVGRTVSNRYDASDVVDYSIQTESHDSVTTVLDALKTPGHDQTMVIDRITGDPAALAKIEEALKRAKMAQKGKPDDV